MRRMGALMVAAWAVAAVALLAAGGAVAKHDPQDHWTISLAASPSTVSAGGTVTLSGTLLNNGDQGVGNQEVTIRAFANASCAGESTLLATAETMNGAGVKGNYAVDHVFGSAGTYSLRAEATGNGEGKDATSGCVIVAVTGSGGDTGDDDGGDGGSSQSGVGVASVPTSSGPDRYGYCSVEGNTAPDGAPLAPGTFLNLLLGQPESDSNYTGATPAFWVEGVGITCDAGFAQAQGIGSTEKVNHVGKPTEEDGPTFYTYVPRG